MELDKFLNLLAAIFGALGGIYVMLGIIAMSPDLMLRLSQPAWDFSLSQIEALTDQKGDNIAGFVFVVFAFGLAAVTIFVPTGMRVFQSRWLPLALAAILAVGLYATLHYLSKGISRLEKISIGRLVTLQRLDEIISVGRMDSSDSHTILVYAKLLELDVLSGESTRSLTQRVASEVGKALPPNLDYSAVEPKK